MERKTESTMWLHRKSKNFSNWMKFNFVVVVRSFEIFFFYLKNWYHEFKGILKFFVYIECMNVLQLYTEWNINNTMKILLFFMLNGNILEFKCEEDGFLFGKLNNFLFILLFSYWCTVCVCIVYFFLHSALNAYMKRTSSEKLENDFVYVYYLLCIFLYGISNETNIWWISFIRKIISCI